MTIRELSTELDRECSLWDWARTAGISAGDLRKALRQSLERSREDGRQEVELAR